LGRTRGPGIEGECDITRVVLSRYENRIKHDLGQIDATFQALAQLHCVRVFGLDEEMLNRATDLALAVSDTVNATLN
jgi:hypothetical protein